MEQDQALRGRAQWMQAQGVESELKTELKRKDHFPRFEDIDKLINLLRAACEKTIFTDVEYAATQDVDQRLWAAHGLIKDRYKKLIAHYRDREPRKHVEKRKMEQRYANFIKTTQFHYKGYIQRLAVEFGGLDGLRRIANRLSLAFDNSQPHPVSPVIRDLVEKACYTTLLHLGDLSRYRNDIRTKDRSWEPALGYYSLAADLCPDSGSSHNQMAIIALADENHLDAVYRLYRALAVKNPHPLAEGNLEIEFKKIITRWEKAPNMKGNSEAKLILWFVRLHAKFYAGTRFPVHDELETEVLSHLAPLLKEESFEVTLQKLVLVNIAAEFFASERIEKKGAEFRERGIESFNFFLRFNIRFLSVLLQAILPEFEAQGTGDSLPNANEESQQDKKHQNITSVAKRVLPALRQYSSWLVFRTPFIIATADKKPISQYIQEMWRTYARVLTRFLQAFPIEELPVLDYLLEEDKTTVGFKPFCDSKIPIECSLLNGMDGQLKPRITRHEVPQDVSSFEMKGRIRDIIICAVSMQHTPIDLDPHAMKFTFLEEALQQTGSGYIEAATPRETIPQRSRGKYKTPKSVTVANQDKECTEGRAASDSLANMDNNMTRMVDSLVEPSPERHRASNETSYGMHTLTANEIFVPLSNDSYPVPTINPPWVPPGLSDRIWTPPQPNELQHNNAKRPDIAHNRTPIPLATREQQVDAAAGLDSLTGYADSQGRPSARRNSRFSTNTGIQAFSQRYMSVPSGFSSSNASLDSSKSPRGGWALGGRAAGPGLSSIANGNDSTTYEGGSAYDTEMMLKSSLWYDKTAHTHSPPSGQGG